MSVTDLTLRHIFLHCRIQAARFGLVLIGSLVLLPAYAQDMRTTPHNLVRSRGIGATDSGQVCVFCHTPVVSEAGTPSPARWQSVVPSEFSFPMFDDIGRLDLEGSTAVGSQSIACLSCHDSVQAFAAASLTYDHPFGVPYRGALREDQREQAMARALADGVPFREARLLRDTDDFLPAYRGIVDGRPVWWTSRRGNADRRNRDDLPLYVRRDDSDDSEVPFIECASCHDPHSTNAMFIRGIPNEGGLCLTCHIK